MKKSLLFLILIISIFSTRQAAAQKLSKLKLISAGFGIEGGLPTGDFKDTYHTAAGVTARFSVHLGPGFATLTSGAIAYWPKNLGTDNLNASIQVPIKAGYKYIFLKHLFIMGEAGFSTFHFYIINSNTGTEIDDRQSGFTIAPAIGVQFGVLEIGARYETTHLKTASLSMTALRVGFNF